MNGALALAVPGAKWEDKDVVQDSSTNKGMTQKGGK